MAWVATEDFEYSVGLLNTQNGGSGWSGAWSADAGLTVVSSPTFSGTGAVLVNSVAGGDGSRSLTTGVTSGIVRVYIYATNVPTGTKGYYPALFRDGGTIVFRLAWGVPDTGSSGNTIRLNNGGGTAGVTLSSSASAATWYYVDVEFDQAGSQARASFNGGAWSAFVSNAFTSISNYRITVGDGNVGDQGYHVDNIGVGTGPVTAVVSLNHPTLLTLGVG